MKISTETRITLELSIPEARILLHALNRAQYGNEPITETLRETLAVVAPNTNEG